MKKIEQNEFNKLKDSPNKVWKKARNILFKENEEIMDKIIHRNNLYIGTKKVLKL